MRPPVPRLRSLGLVAVAVAALTGPAAASAATWAVVDSSGALARGAGVVSTAQLGTGGYEVIFNRNVSKCAFNAQVGLTGSSGTVTVRAYATTARRDTNVNGVFVQTLDAGGARTSFPFHLQVQCASAKPWAVVTKAGPLGRGKHVLGTRKIGTGAYVVTFDRDVSRCTFIATVGTGVGGVAEPGIAAVANDVDPRAVFVQTSTTSGSPADRPFHLQPICGKAVPTAVVGTGTFLARGAHVLSVDDNGGGSAIVHFDRTVAACSFVATPGSTGGGIPSPASVTTVGRAGDQNAVFVETISTGGASADFPFHLVVQC